MGYLYVSLPDLPWRSANVSPGGSCAQVYGVLCALLEFSQPRFYNRGFFGQFQLSFPAQRSGFLATPVMVAKRKAIPLFGAFKRR
jgi:hypothetical protein